MRTAFHSWHLASALAAALLLSGAVPAAATGTPRYGHATALMPNGKILITGGVDDVTAGGPYTLSSVEIMDTTKGGTLSDAASMGTARSSHTITVLPNGKILVTGGWDGAGVLNTAEIYTPAAGAGSWAAAGTLGTTRFNHTATLLGNGTVLICGGQTSVAAPAVSNTCDIYTPNAGVGTIAQNVLTLNQGRALHTATLLNDGQVWIAGGWNPTATPTYLVTTERYNGATWQNATPLIQARVYHTATLTGEGKVLVVGGYNGKDVKRSLGVLDTAELYDPVSGSVVPAAPPPVRVQSHATVLMADGGTVISGGLGNITTSYFNASTILNPGGYVTGNFATYYATYTDHAPINTGSMQIPIDMFLGTPVTGQIYDGEIWLSKPMVTLGGVLVRLTQTDPSSAAGIRLDLKGRSVGCNETLVCGRLVGDFNITNINSGSFELAMPLSATVDTPMKITNLAPGQINFAPDPLTLSNNAPATLTAGSNVTVDGVRFYVPKFLYTDTVANPGNPVHHITNLRFNVTAAAWSDKTAKYTAAITGGSAQLTGVSYPVSMDINNNYYFDVPNQTLQINNLVGTISLNTDDAAYSLPSGTVVPTVAQIAMDSLSGNLFIGVDGLELTDGSFSVDVATVVIRKMVFGDLQFYSSKANQWAYNRVGSGPIIGYGATRFGASATLLPNNDIVYVGGKACNGKLACASLVAKNDFGIPPALRLDDGRLTTAKTFTAGTGSDQRALHTATLLPDGTILVAGGSNGSNVLPTAQIFNPAGVGSFSSTLNLMIEPRDMHSATLLPNGRVLLAGGLTTNAISTGSTNTAEIYYPDTKLFMATQPMANKRSNHSAVLLPNGNVFVAGGYGANDLITDTAEIYNPETGLWTPTATLMPQKRALHSTVLLQDGTVLLCGGVDSNGITNTCVTYNYLSDTWAAAADMPSPLRSHTATLLFDGRVLVAGGNDGYGEANVSYTYNGAWSVVASTNGAPLYQARFGHNATLLPNGNVMISGGVDSFGIAAKQLEIFHPNARFPWVYADNDFSGGARSFHTMTLAPNGNLYAIGGSDGMIGGAGVTFLSAIEQGYFTDPPDGNSTVSPSMRQSTITAVTPALFDTAAPPSIVVKGLRFRGATEANGGAAGPGSSAFSFPHLMLQRIDGSGGGGPQGGGGFVANLTESIYANAANMPPADVDKNLTVQLPTLNSLPYGWYMTWVGDNDIHTNRAPMVQAGPAKPLTATASIASVVNSVNSITWSWSAIGSVDGYNIYDATTGFFITAVQAPTVNFTQNTLAPNATASIIVAGYTRSGDGPLAHSNTYYTLAAAPINPTITDVTFSGLTLRWETNGNTPGTVYEVSMTTDVLPVTPFSQSVSTPVPQILCLTTTYATISNLQPNTQYTFRVVAYNEVGVQSAFSANAMATTRSAVYGLGGTPMPMTTTAIQWAWLDAGSSVLNYKVYNSTTGALLGSPTGTTFDDTGLGVNTARSVYVTAVTAAGEGPISDSATAYTLAATPGAINPPIVNLTTGSLTLQWTNNGNPLGTQYKAEGSVIVGSQTVTDSYTTTDFTRSIGNLQPATLYTINVFALNGAGTLSTPLVVGSTYTLARAPSSLQVLGTTPVSISLSWDTNSNSENATYQLTYSTDNFVTVVATAVPFSANFNGSSATITGLLTSRQYWMKVWARNPFGQETQTTLVVTTITYNGGAAPGSLAGLVRPLENSSIAGNIELPGGLRTIEFRSPSGAFPTDVTVTVSNYNVVTSPCPNGVNIALQLDVNPALQPAKPLYLTASYSTAELGGLSPSRAVLMRYDPDSKTCVPLETVFDTKSLTFRAKFNHFSLYQIAQSPLATTAGTARIFPNPYHTATDAYVTIDNVPPGSRIRIMTLRGETILDQTADTAGMLTWSATNGAGRAVASGLYLVVIESGATKKILKLAVIR